MRLYLFFSIEAGFILSLRSSPSFPSFVNPLGPPPCERLERPVSSLQEFFLPQEAFPRRPVSARGAMFWQRLVVLEDFFFPLDISELPLRISGKIPCSMAFASAYLSSHCLLPWQSAPFTSKLSDYYLPSLSFPHYVASSSFP